MIDCRSLTLVSLSIRTIPPENGEPRNDLEMFPSRRTCRGVDDGPLCAGWEEGLLIMYFCYIPTTVSMSRVREYIEALIVAVQLQIKN